MAKRWLWAQGSDTRSVSGTQALLDVCTSCHFTDLAFLANSSGGVLWNSSYFRSSAERVDGLHYMDYLVREAKARNIRVHAWITLGYWRGLWANRNAGCPEAWNCASLSNWDTSTYGEWVNLSRPDVQAAVGAAVEDILAHNPDLAGVSLDYVRLQPATERKDGRLTGEHVTTCVRQAKTAMGDRTLTVTGVPLWAEGYQGYNYDIHGCSQNWPAWILDGLVDYVLAMNYYGADNLDSMLNDHYDPLPADVRAKVIDLVSPTAHIEEGRMLGIDEWNRLVATNEAHGYDLSVSDNKLLTSGYQSALKQRPLPQPSPEPTPGPSEELMKELQQASTQLAASVENLETFVTSLSDIIHSLNETADRLELEMSD
jgi:hypothetical protein